MDNGLDFLISDFFASIAVYAGNELYYISDSNEISSITVFQKKRKCTRGMALPCVRGVVSSCLTASDFPPSTALPVPYVAKRKSSQPLHFVD